MAKNTRVSIYLLLLLGILFCQSNIAAQYDYNKLDDYNYNIKTMAIMPFKLYTGRNGTALDTTAAMQKEATIKKSYELQQQLYSWFTKQKKCSVIFQDVHKTDSLLKRTKLSFDALMGLDQGALCKYLGVDAVAFCEIRMSNPTFDIGREIRKDLANSTISVLSGMPVSGINREKSNRTTYKMSISDNTGEEVWRYSNKEIDWAYNDTDLLIKAFIFTMSYKLPF